MAKSMRIRTDDHVVVISGKDSGKTGRVVRTDPKRRGFTTSFAAGIAVSGEVVWRKPKPEEEKPAETGGDDIPV